MSLVRPILNTWLRWTERRFLSHAKDPQGPRKRLELMARFLFRGPRGATYDSMMLDNVPALRVTGPGTREAGVILYFHGGGYFFGSPNTHRKMLARLSQLSGVPAILPDYRKAPENVFPAALQDAVTAYREVLETTPAEQVVIGGDSAGGGLAFALLHEICTSGAPQPAMTFAMAPWVDLSDRNVAHRPTARSEAILPPERLFEVASEYAGDTDPRDPRVSPVFGTFDGAGEVLILVSDSEVLFDDSRRMTETLHKQGVPVTLSIERDLPHVWPIFHWILPEADRSLKQLAGAVRSVLNLPLRKDES